jgi:hypothetical protein
MPLSLRLRMDDLSALPPDLPVPVDDGAADRAADLTAVDPAVLPPRSWSGWSLTRLEGHGWHSRRECANGTTVY